MFFGGIYVLRRDLCASEGFMCFGGNHSLLGIHVLRSNLCISEGLGFMYFGGIYVLQRGLCTSEGIKKE